MVNILKILYFCLLAALALLSCSKDEEEINPSRLSPLEELDKTAHLEQRYFQNNPLPVGKKSLRVLCIGNSYTSDALSCVPAIMQAAGISDANYSIYQALISGSSLRTWWNTIAYEDTLQLDFVAGSKMPLSKGPWKDLLAQKWDIVTLQQYSGDAVNYDTFNPWLRKLIDFIKDNCPNPSVTLAWQTAWSYSSLYNQQMTPYERWLYISLAVKQMVINDGIDVLIPVGTAIQNARSTSLNTVSELTRDGTHLDLGVGRYTASCTWYQALIAPVFDLSVMGNEALPPMGTSPNIRYPSQPVTADNRELCQRCAVAAVEKPFEVMR